MRLAPLITAVVLVAGGYGGWHWLKASANQAPGAREAGPRAGGGGRRGGAARGDNAVPVVVANVAKENVSVYRDGIGTVQSLAAVTVRSQVDGRLLSVDFTEGQTVKKGDVLARIDPTVYKALYDQAVAKKAQDEATLANARIDLQRYQRLAQTNAGPKQQADQQQAVVNQLEAQVKSDDAAIANAKAVLDYTTIVSPIEGRTGLRQIDVGNIVKGGDASGLVSITQVKPIAVVFTLPQRDLAVVNQALVRGGAVVEAMEQEGRGVLARGTLQTIDNQIDVSTGTIRLKATFPNDDQKLWPGQFISTRVAIDTLTDAKVVPATAVRRGPNGTFVYVVGEDDKAVVRPVKVVLQDEARAVLSDGVEIGQRVVTLGFAQLSDGKPVTVSGGTPGVVPAAVDGAAPRGERKRGEGGGRGKREGGGEGAGAKEGAGKEGAKEGAKEGGREGGGKRRREQGEPPIVPPVVPPIVAPARPG